MPREHSPATTVIANLVEKYGRERTERLLKLLERQVSGQVIADEFEVSRERVRQWKYALGGTVSTYIVDPAVKDYLTRLRRT